MVEGLAVSRGCDGTDALRDLRAPGGWMALLARSEADGAGEPGLGLQADPGRVARPWVPGGGFYGAAGAEAPADPARASAEPLDVEAVPARPGIHDAGLC